MQVQKRDKKKKTAATETADRSNDNKLVTGFKVEGAGGIGGKIDRYFTFSADKIGTRFEVADVDSSELKLIVEFYESTCPDDQIYDVAIAIRDICKRLEIECPIDLKAAEAHKADDNVRARRTRQGHVVHTKSKKEKNGTRASKTVN